MGTKIPAHVKEMIKKDKEEMKKERLEKARHLKDRITENGFCLEHAYRKLFVLDFAIRGIGDTFGISEHVAMGFTEVIDEVQDALKWHIYFKDDYDKGALSEKKLELVKEESGEAAANLNLALAHVGVTEEKVKEIVDTAKLLYDQLPLFNIDLGSNLLNTNSKDEEDSYEELYSVFGLVEEKLKAHIGETEVGEIFEALDDKAGNYMATYYKAGFIRGYLLGNLGVRPFDVESFINLSAAYKQAVSEKGGDQNDSH